MSREKIVFANSVEPSLRSLITLAVAKIGGLYGIAAGRPFRQPQIFVTQHDRSNRNYPRFHGDVTNKNMVRLTFFQNKHDAKQPAYEVEKFIAHEFAHVIQPHADITNDPDETMILEGNAEFAALLTMPSFSSDYLPNVLLSLSGAVNRCLLATNGMAWRTVKDKTSGRLPYDCGVAFNLADLLDRRVSRDQSPLNAHLVRNRLIPTRWLDLLGSGDSRRVASLLDGYDEIGSWLPEVLTPILIASDRAELPNDASYRSQVSIAVFKDILSNDCQSTSGYWIRRDYFELEGSKGCRSLRDGMRVRSLEGVSIADDPIEAITRASNSCSHSGHFEVALVNGTMVRVGSCANGFLQPKFINIEPSLLADALFGVRGVQ